MPAVERQLPAFVAPMLAAPGEPFDSDEHLFEVKWDGTRVLMFVDEAGACRLVNRRAADVTGRFPELARAGAALAAGTVLDGEVVVLAADGRPDFQSLQSREHASPGRKAEQLSRVRPATFVAFDQLYRGYESIMAAPCSERREVLRETLAGVEPARLVFSDGVVGPGKVYFARCCERGLEGVVAKRLNSPYQPGKRSGAWVKIKRREEVACAVIGFVAEGADDFGSLILAGEFNGAVQYVGKVGTGFDARRRRRVNRYLWASLCDAPAVACKRIKDARWVRPGLYCTVRCMERTAAGSLRAPALVDVFEAPQGGAPGAAPGAASGAAPLAETAKEGGEGLGSHGGRA